MEALALSRPALVKEEDVLAPAHAPFAADQAGDSDSSSSSCDDDYDASDASGEDASDHQAAEERSFPVLAQEQPAAETVKTLETSLAAMPAMPQPAATSMLSTFLIAEGEESIPRIREYLEAYVKNGCTGKYGACFLGQPSKKWKHSKTKAAADIAWAATLATVASSSLLENDQPVPSGPVFAAVVAGMKARIAALEAQQKNAAASLLSTNQYAEAQAAEVFTLRDEQARAAEAARAQAAKEQEEKQAMLAQVAAAEEAAEAAVARAARLEEELRMSSRTAGLLALEQAKTASLRMSEQQAKEQMGSLQTQLAELRAQAPSFAAASASEAVAKKRKHEHWRPDKETLTSLLKAAWNGQQDIINRLLPLGVNPDEVHDGNGRTLMDLALASKSINPSTRLMMVRELLKRGAGRSAVQSALPEALVGLEETQQQREAAMAERLTALTGSSNAGLPLLERVMAGLELAAARSAELSGAVAAKNARLEELEQDVQYWRRQHGAKVAELDAEIRNRRTTPPPPPPPPPPLPPPPPPQRTADEMMESGIGNFILRRMRAAILRQPANLPPAQYQRAMTGEFQLVMEEVVPSALEFVAATMSNAAPPP